MARTKDRLPQPTLERIRAIERGLPYGRLSRLASTLKESELETADRLQIARRTLARRKREGVLKPDESERVARFEQLHALAVGLFEGDKETARAWLASPNRALANRTPLDFARTELGAREVENLIGRLEHGVFT